MAFYQVEPVIKAEQAPTNHWAPGPTNWWLGGEFLAKVVPAPTTGTPAANSGNYVVQATIRADLGDKGVYYRAQIGTFATLEQAWELCSSLKSTGAQCIVQGDPDPVAALPLLRAGRPAIVTSSGGLPVR